MTAIETNVPRSITYPRIRSSGVDIDTSPKHFGMLRNANALLNNPAALRQQINEDGYLYLPGLLNRSDVLSARAEVVRRAQRDGLLKAGTDPMDGIIESAKTAPMKPIEYLDNEVLMKVLYSGPMINFFEVFLGGPVKHFDFTWFRAIFPGHGTRSHCDSVYMNRGTQNLFTAWTPLGDISMILGGLMVLEGSNNNHRLKETYCRQDVDSFCENKPDSKKWGKAGGTSGHLQGNPNRIRQSIAAGQSQGGGRWLTAEYKAGDVLIFTIFTVHASLDNQTTDRIRLSSDSRYQLASEPADDRWMGPNPVGHGAAGKRGKIC